MLGTVGLRSGLLAAFALLALQVMPAQAQLVDTPQNLLKAWAEAYASRSGDPMARVYSRDAQLWGRASKEPSLGIDSIKQYFDRTGLTVSERSATITRMQITSRKRLTFITGTMELKSKLKDGAARNSPTRFTMSILRESRRQWSIVAHHMSPMP